MSDIKDIFVRHRKYIFYLLSIYVLGYGFTPYQSVFLGLIFGTALSLYNLWVMVRKTERFGQAIAEGRKVMSIGTFSRLASAALAVMISFRFPEYFHSAGVIVGLMTSYIVIMIDIIIQTIRK
ncbi:ATP synthase subunit I [Bacillus salitolerans]|uniref:ATP synthase subunit I n=1 Tax=Bacillus salitolerans TaxID=1437434 RepID=A0ABW4LJH4_9BACI